MMNAFPAIKFFGFWVCVIGAVVFLALGHVGFALPGVLALLAIAFAQAPVSW